uniref:Ribonuclease P protein subunit p29 n=1 Tax=Aegilops tauschii TaxID=37682 RepID=N1QT67_AEGTA
MSTISDQKKRTLEAIQQRYAAAKAKKLKDEQPKCLKNKESTPKPKFDARRKGKTPQSTPSRTSGQLPTFRGGEINPIYSELSFALHENLSQDDHTDLDSTDIVHSIVYDIIQKGGESGKIAKGSKNDQKHMSLKQHKKCGSFDLHDKFRRFDLYKPMNEMWKEYMRELTKSIPKKQLSENLLSADLHGALIIVAQCKAVSYEGVSGIMIRDTAETFGIISEDNRFRDLMGLLSKKLTLKPAVVPKAGSVFVLQADCWKVTLIGDKLSPKEKLKESQRLQRAQSLIR